MKRFLKIIITVLLLCGMFYIVGCSSKNSYDNVDNLTEEQISSVQEDINETAIQDTIDQLSLMEERQIEYITGDIKYAPWFPLKTLSELEERSELILKATAISAGPNTHLDKRDCITLTTIRIDEVIVSDGSLKNGDETILIEYYRIEEDPYEKNKINIFSSNGSMPMRKNQQYLLFLKKPSQTYGDYAIVAAYQGKYPIAEKTLSLNASDLTEDDLELFEGNYTDSMKLMVQDIFDKYLK